MTKRPSPAALAFALGLAAFAGLAHSQDGAAVPAGTSSAPQSLSDDAAPPEDELDGGTDFEAGRGFTPGGVPSPRFDARRDLRAAGSDLSEREIRRRLDRERAERRLAREDRRDEDRRRSSSWRSVERDDDRRRYAAGRSDDADETSSRGWRPASRLWTGTLTSDRAFTYVFSGPGAVLATKTSIRALPAGDAATISLSGPHVIDVEAARLDKRALAPGQIETVQRGGAKIIRLGPPLDGAPGPGRVGAAAQPDGAAGELEPWSLAWERSCVLAHASFDPETGTYALADGRRRFCTGA
ncbi:BA14K family protein [Aurantimonas sp. Leaf443]|uniref:BA14K family protein n=1 Tax=Aurantimonas sp. Leaf443 TaxID=1736378 RepID=UPI0006F5A3EC|nr:BA14K family protein [Aurantimonas sp. Leaf443]KQT82540.1 hypothetical protein ASG48_15865 [Aurantimonas sp. Leaf443]